GAGNAVLVIEHEPIVIRAADRMVELGPGAGPAGGQVVYDGRPLVDSRGAHAARRERRRPAETLTITGARANNLRDVTVEIPLGAVVAVTGPSGSGKSTLVEEVLFRGLARARGYRDVDAPGAYRAITGSSGIVAPLLVDQAPLGRTSRGNPATYT